MLLFSCIWIASPNNNKISQPVENNWSAQVIIMGPLSDYLHSWQFQLKLRILLEAVKRNKVSTWDSTWGGSSKILLKETLLNRHSSHLQWKATPLHSIPVHPVVDVFSWLTDRLQSENPLTTLYYLPSMPRSLIVHLLLLLVSTGRLAAIDYIVYRLRRPPSVIII